MYGGGGAVAKKAAERRIDTRSVVETWAQLNLDKSIYLARFKQPRNGLSQCMVKVTALIGANPQQQQVVLSKTFGATTYYLKPEGYDIQEDGNLYLLQKVQPLSLQAVIAIHRREEKSFGREFMRQFTVRMYEGLARIKFKELFPQNLKPSNIFMEWREGERSWVWSEAGLHTNRRSQPYFKMNFQNLAKNASLKVDPVEMEFYSLAVILVELATLQPSEHIDKLIRAGGSLGQLKNYTEAMGWYGEPLVSIIRMLLEPPPPRDPTLSKAIQQYKDMLEEDDEAPDYDAYAQTEERLNGYLRDGLMKRVEEQAREHIQKNGLSARDVFDVMARLDSSLDFYFLHMADMNALLGELGVKTTPDELLFVTTFYTSDQHVKYFKLVQSLLPAKQLIECIICKAVENYNDSFKEFFEAQTDGREFWKADGVKEFLDSIDAPFEKAEVDQTVEAWSGPNKTAVKYDELFKVFKPLLGMSMSFTNFNKSKSKIGEPGNDEPPLKGMMEHLKEKYPDLVEFFRKYDLKQNWILDYKIEGVLGSYFKGDKEAKKRAFVEMWEKGSIPGEFNKQLNYVYLLRNMEMYEPITLLRLILTTIINESDRDTFYKKYQRGEGWTIQSFVDFNRDENLDFGESELRSLFREIDADGSDSVSSRQLFYRLTGLKDFDYKAAVEDVQHAINRQGISIFDLFLQSDSRARMVLSSPSDLDNVLRKLGVSLSEDHLSQLYAKSAPTGKFEYLRFVREFQEKKGLFLAATRAVLRQNYRNNFDKLFEMGLRDGRSMWNRQSLIMVNEQMVLGFSTIELGQIWEQIVTKDGVLSKEQVAAIYDYEVEKLTQLERKHVESLEDIKKKQQKEGDANDPSVRVPTSHKIEDKEKPNKVIDELKEEVGLRKIAALSVSFLKESPSFNGSIREQAAIGVLQSTGIRCNKKEISQFISPFISNKLVNYIKLVFFAIEKIAEEGSRDRPAGKADVIKALIKAIKVKEHISNEDLMKMCKKSERMRLSDFEKVIERMVEVEVFYEDVEEIWMHWQIENYITEPDLDQLLETQEFKNKPEKEETKPKGELMPPSLLPKKASSKIASKLGSDNRMADFINESEGSTPYMKKEMSFGERQNSRKSSRKGSFKEQGYDPSNRTGNQSPPLSNFKQNSQREKGEELTGRFHESTRRNAPKEEKIELQEKEEFGFPFKKFASSKRVAPSKQELVDKMVSQIGEKGESYLNELFSRNKNKVVEMNRFEGCLKIHYGFQEEEAKELTKSLEEFGKIKESSIINEIKKHSSPKTAQKTHQKDRVVERTDEKRGPKENQRLKTPPHKDKQRDGKRLVDPRKLKINVPVVKQQIRHLLHLFMKRFDLSQLQSFFFHQNKFAKQSKTPKEMIDRETFAKTCQSIDPTVSDSMCDKMFTFMRPDNQDRVGLMGFRLGMGPDELVQEEEDDYLPEDLEKELRAVFEKADADHSGYIESNEIERLLSSLGFNENVRELQNYFARLDKNFDNKIEYSEFRYFIQDQILPQISNFDEDQEQLEEALINNDVFRSGALAPNTFQAVIDRYGVKLFPQEVQKLVRDLNPEGTDIGIHQLLEAVREPTRYKGKVRGILYKIRLRKKVQLREIQRVFESIASASFVLAYTPSAMNQRLLNISTPFAPSLHECGLFYSDLPIKDMRKIGQENEASVGGQILPGDIMVQILLKELTGVPIPQRNQIKNNIIRRYINVSLFDLSSDTVRHAIWQVEVQWQADVEDQWLIPKTSRSLFVKVGGYDHRKYEKMVLLFELVIGVVDVGRTLEINCGCCTVPLRELLVPEGKTNKVMKLIAGLPNRMKELDSNAITKRGGLKAFFGGSVESQLQIDLVHRQKFRDYHAMLAAMPSHAVIPRKSLPYFYGYRQFVGDLAYAGGSLNPVVNTDHLVMTFLHTLDVPELTNRVWLWWKLKVEPKNLSIGKIKKVFRVLMQQLNLIVNSRQFELLRKCPTRSLLHNKTLSTTRVRLTGEALDNVEAWLDAGVDAPFKRRKNYALNYGPMQMHEVEIPREHRNFLQMLNRLSVR